MYLRATHRSFWPWLNLLLLLFALPAHAEEAPVGFWAALEEIIIKDNVQLFVSKLLTIRSGGSTTAGNWLGIWVGWGILLMSLFQLYRWVTLINSGSLKEPLAAFAKLVINCIIIGVCAAPSGTSSVMYTWLTGIDGFSRYLTSTIESAINTTTSTSASFYSAPDYMGSVAARNASKTKEGKNYWASVQPELFGLPWSKYGSGDGWNYVKEFTSSTLLVPIKTKGGGIYIALGIPSADGSLALGKYTTNNVIDKSAAASNPDTAGLVTSALAGDADQSPVLTMQNSTHGKSLLLLGRPLNDMVTDYVNAYKATTGVRSYPSDPPWPAAFRTTVSTVISTALAKGGVLYSLPNALEQKEKAANLVQQTAISWIKKQTGYRTGNELFASDTAASRQDGSLLGLPTKTSLVKAITDWFTNVTIWIANVLTGILLIITRLAFWVQAPFLYMSLPFLLATSDTLRNSFWTQLKSMIMFAIIPAFVGIANAVLWGCIYQPMLNIVIDCSAITAVAKTYGNTVGTVAGALTITQGFGNGIIMAAFLLLTYPIVLAVSAVLATKAVFGGKSVFGGMLGAMMATTGAALAIGGGAALGAGVGGLAAIAKGGGALKALTGAASGAASSAASGVAQASGMASGGTIGAIQELRGINQRRKAARGATGGSGDTLTGAMNNELGSGGGGGGGGAQPATAGSTSGSQARSQTRSKLAAAATALSTSATAAQAASDSSDAPELSSPSSPSSSSDSTPFTPTGGSGGGSGSGSGGSGSGGGGSGSGSGSGSDSSHASLTTGSDVASPSSPSDNSSASPGTSEAPASSGATNPNVQVTVQADTVSGPTNATSPNSSSGHDGNGGTAADHARADQLAAAGRSEASARIGQGVQSLKNQVLQTAGEATDSAAPASSAPIQAAPVAPAQQPSAKSTPPPPPGAPPPPPPALKQAVPQQTAAAAPPSGSTVNVTSTTTIINTEAAGRESL